jgi:hypothetical protein
MGGKKMNILSLLASSSFITVNKDLIKAVGIEAALLFGELASEYSYWSDSNDDYFYSTVENLEEKTTLNDYQQRKAIKVLKDKGLIEVKIKGVPAKRYFKINDNAVLKIFDIQFFENLRTGSEKIKEQDLEIFQGNNNINNNNIKNNNIKKEKVSGFDSIISEYTENENLRQTIVDFIGMRKAIKHQLTDRALKMTLTKLDSLSSTDEGKIKILEQSIFHSWQGVFPLKEEPEEQQTGDGIKWQ